MNNNVVENFNNDIKKVINLIKDDKQKEACLFFNEIVFKKYEKNIRDKENPLVFFEIFFTDLDNYLNNEATIALGVINKNSIIGSYYSDYQEDLKLALKKEQEKK